MSKKHYQAIARALYRSLRAEAVAGKTIEDIRAEVIGQVEDVLAADSPRFDRARFIEACETGTTRGMRKVSA